jgi:PIN domain nuclease of toxin-antitoxin system
LSLLLDTHVLLWWMAESPKLSKTTRARIADTEAVYVSAASAWEMAIKAAIGKLRVPDDLEEQLQRHRFEQLPISIAHALAVTVLPRHHADPFDRMLVAQASIESLTLVTTDPQLGVYGVPILRA